MKTKFCMAWSWMFMGLLLLLPAVSCSSIYHEESRRDAVRVEMSSRDRGMLFPVFVSREGTHLVVAGTIHGTNANPNLAKVHVELMDAQGNRLCQADTAIVAGYFSRSGWSNPRFEKSLPFPNTPGLTVKIAYEASH